VAFGGDGGHPLAGGVALGFTQFDFVAGAGVVVAGFVGGSGFELFDAGRIPAEGDVDDAEFVGDAYGDGAIGVVFFLGCVDPVGLAADFPPGESPYEASAETDLS